MKTIYILLVSLFLTSSLYAQRNLKSGYIITNENDTIIGLIDFRTDVANGGYCRFKETDSSKEQIFYPNDITKYRFINEGKYYVSHDIKIDNKTKTVFLEYLVQGVMDLYYYNDSESQLAYYFFIDADGNMVPLTKKQDEIIDYRIKSDERYKGALKYLFSKYPSIDKKIDKTSFDRGTFINLTKEYHDLTCTSGESCIVFENDYKKNFIKVDFSVYSGLQLANYSLVDIPKYSFESMKSVYPMIGGQVTITNPRWTKWIAFQADLSLSPLEGKGDYLQSVTYFKYDFKALMINTKVKVKYTLSIDNSKFRPTAELGFSYIQLLNTSSTYYIEKRGLQTIYTDKRKDYLLPEKAYLGFNTAIGLNYMIKDNRCIFAQLAYEKATKAGGKIQLMQLRLGYTF